MHPISACDLLRQEHERRLADAAVERANARARADRHPSDATRRPPSRAWLSTLLSAAPSTLTAR